MKKILSILLAITLLVSGSGLAHALPKPEKSDILKTLSKRSQTAVISAEELFTSLVDIAGEGEGIPATYKFIQVKTNQITAGTRLHRAYQKAIYLDLIPNDGTVIDLSGVATQRKLVELVQKMYGKKVNGEILVNGHKFDIVEKKVLRNADLVAYAQGYLENSNDNETPAQNRYQIESAPNFALLNDIYVRLSTEHADKATFESVKLLQGAMVGMAEATGDKYTSYFPPAEAKAFDEGLNGNFEGIGAYVDMEQPGILTVTSPLVGSPAEAAGILGGDIIKKVDDTLITKEMTLSDAIKKIKGPAGTHVKLIITRGANDITFDIVRKAIHVELVTYKKLDSNTSYIQVTSFGDGAAEAFSGALSKATNDHPTKLILDLRNNPGGSLEEVSDMLNFFVPLGKSKINIIGNGRNESFVSTGKTDALKNIKLVILINQGSASASEIMTGTIKDYLPDQTRILGEKSYGKGSVQSYIPYSDGSSVKYTTAKWYTGKTSTGIDHIGISPDIEVKYDREAFKKGTDNQLDAARNLNF